MNILTELVKLLSDYEVSITTSLLKVKVLASRLNNKSLYEWVSKELSGYNSSDKLPMYRKYGCSVVGSYTTRNSKATNVQLPVSSLPKELQEFLDTVEFYEGIAVLESYLKDEKLSSIQIPLQADLLRIMSEVYQGMGNHFLNLYAGYRHISKGAVEQAISEVRNYALDLILSLEGEFGYEIKMEELIRNKDEVNKTIYNIMSHTVNNTGDGNLINTGSKVSINNKVTIKKGSFEELRKHLKENLVEEADIEELESIVVEQPDKERKLFGPKVNNWLQKMMNKSLDGSWQIGVGTAGNLLAEALKEFYGI